MFKTHDKIKVFYQKYCVHKIAFVLKWTLFWFTQFWEHLVKQDSSEWKNNSHSTGLSH